MYLTLKQCSNLANINVSTARFYKDRYLQYFTTQGEGKTTKFEQDSTVEILCLIKASYAKGYDHDQITEVLDRRYGVNVTDLVTQEADNSTETMQQCLIEVFKEEISRLEDKIDSLASCSDERDKRIMENIRLIQEQNSKTFWQRLRGK